MLTPGQRLLDALPLVLESELRNIPVVNTLAENRLSLPLPRADVAIFSEAIAEKSKLPAESFQPAACSVKYRAVMDVSFSSQNFAPAVHVSAKSNPSAHRPRKFFTSVSRSVTSPPKATHGTPASRHCAANAPAPFPMSVERSIRPSPVMTKSVWRNRPVSPASAHQFKARSDFRTDKCSKSKT